VVDLEAGPAPFALPALVRAGAPVFLLAAALRPGAPRVLGALAALAAYLRRETPDALVAALTYPNAVALLARRLAALRVPVAITVHNHLTQSANHANRWRERMGPRVIEAFAHEADRVIAVSRGVARDLSARTGLPAERIETVYNPVVTPDLWRLAEKASDHAWFRGDVPVVLAAGKLKAQKDFATLIRAFAKLRTRRAARLVILGEGPERVALESLARQLGIAAQVDLAGFRENPYALMRRASVFVLSSAWEGFGNVLVEAMACGAPVVSTRCPSGPEEILDGGRYGALVPVGDSDALCDAIDATIDAPLDRPILQRRAQDFSRDAIVRRYEALLFPARGSPQRGPAARSSWGSP
jgi:glycosyltransferase involved in cell wall biosynthesis